jgi:hypothetical protein
MVKSNEICGTAAALKNMVDAVPSHSYVNVMRAAWVFLCKMMLLVLVTAGMTVPASAWAAHEATHGGQQVAASQHHFHDAATGDIAVHDHVGNEERPDSDRGHDHSPGLIVAQADLPATPLTLAAPMIATPLYFPLAGAAVRSIATDRLRRPPRFV